MVSMYQAQIMLGRYCFVNSRLVVKLAFSFFRCAWFIWFLLLNSDYKVKLNNVFMIYRLIATTIYYYFHNWMHIFNETTTKWNLSKQICKKCKFFFLISYNIKVKGDKTLHYQHDKLKNLKMNILISFANLKINFERGYLSFFCSYLISLKTAAIFKDGRQSVT